MTQEIFGLRYEFVYRHGHYMELFKEEGLEASALSPLQVRMLEANQIPRLLPLDIHEVDSRLRLLYRLSSKRMLSHVLKVETFSIPQFAKLMFAIVSTLEESKNYMLAEMNYVLKENFIFVGQDWSDVFLTYVPLDMRHVEDNVSASIDSLFRKLIMYAEMEEQDRLQVWITSDLEMKNLQWYKEALLKLMDEPILKQTSHSDVTSRDIVLNQASSSSESGLPKAHWKRDEHNQNKRDHNVLTSNEASDTLDTNIIPISFTPLNQRGRWITIAIILILFAFLWQQYVRYPSTSTLQLIAGITLLFGDVGFVLLYMGRPEVPKDPKKKVTQPEFASNNPEDQAFNTQKSAAAPLDMQIYYQNLPMHTSLLNPSKPNATIRLGNCTNPQLLGPRLEFLVDGASQSVHINDEIFTIGRGDTSSKVNHVIDIVGVSRIHAEIVRTSNGYQIRDAGSTNGTFLNEQPLVTYQAYPLKDGDILRIIRQEMTFRLSYK